MKEWDSWKRLWHHIEGIIIISFFFQVQVATSHFLRAGLNGTTLSHVIITSSQQFYDRKYFV